MSAKKKAKAKAARSAKPGKASKGPAKKATAQSKPKGKPIAKKVAAKKLAAKKPAAKKPAAKKALVAKKPAAKKALVAKKKTAPVSKLNGKAPSRAPIKRRDATGHLDPAYAADLRARIEEGHPKDDDRAFANDALSDELGEEFVETVTSGEDEGTEIRDQDVPEEVGGPFTVTSAGTEFARDVDESNPKGATREPFPRS